MSVIRDDALSLEDESIELQNVNEMQPDYIEAIEETPETLETAGDHCEAPEEQEYRKYPRWVVLAAQTPLLAGTTGPLSLLVRFIYLVEPPPSKYSLIEADP